MKKIYSERMKKMEKIKNQIHEILKGEDVGVFATQTQKIVENTWERLGRFCLENYGNEDLFSVSAIMLESYLAFKYKSDLGSVYLQTEASRISKLLKLFQRRGIDTKNHEEVLKKFKAQLQK